MNFDEIIYSAIPNPDQYLVGYADMENLLALVYRPFRYAVVVGRRLEDDIIESVHAAVFRPVPSGKRGIIRRCDCHGRSFVQRGH